MIPEYLQVGGLRYPVIVETERNYNAEAEGLCDLRHTKIFIHAGLSSQRKRVTLLHEAFHAVLGGDALTAGVDPLLPAELEERVVSTLAVRVYALLRDNPDLAEFLLEDS